MKLLNKKGRTGSVLVDWFYFYFLITYKRKIKVFAMRMIFLGQWVKVKCLFPGILY